MARLMQNYRKSKKGDIRCESCYFYMVPTVEGLRGRCGMSYSQSYAVSKSNTCDAAEQKMQPTLLESEPILDKDGELIGTRSIEIKQSQSG